MHTPIFLLLVALVCLAAASPVSLTDTASVAVKSSSGGSSSITCRNNKEPRFIPVYRSDWPGRFDVGNGFWARDQYACAVASLNAGFAGSVYRFDTSMCYMKNLPRNPDRRIVSWANVWFSIVVEGVDIPDYDVAPDVASLIVEDTKDASKHWGKYFPTCEQCMVMVLQC